MKKFWWFILFFVLMNNLGNAKEKVDYYNKHIILLVDQTRDVQEHPYLNRIYKLLCDVLSGQDVSLNGGVFPHNFKFNPSLDELSIYSFGLYGNAANYDTPYGKISLNCNLSYPVSRFTDDVVNFLIQDRGSLQESRKNFTSFLEEDVFSLFSRKDSLYSQIIENSGITLSYFVYPSIIDKIDVSIPTKEYFVIIVSNYQSGLTGNSDIADVERLKELAHYRMNYVDDFRKYMDLLEEPFYSIKSLSYISGHQQNDPVVKGFCLRLRSLESTQVYINSNVNLKETDYGETTYELGNVSLAFNHDENILSIDSLILKISDGENLVLKESLSVDYNEENKLFLIPAHEIDLHKVYAEGDALLLEYVFYTTAKNKVGDKLMPMVFVAEREYEFTETDIVSKYQAKNRVIMFYMLISLLIILLVCFLRYVYLKRGRGCLVTMDFSIWPITNTKYMEVKNKKVVSYDCWYWQEGETDRNIPVTGTACIGRRLFAKKYKYVVEFYIDDLDVNEDFSFRPDPVIREKNGNARVFRKYYPVAYEANGNFNFNVNTYLSPQIARPNFGHDNILKMEVKMRVIRIEGDKRYICAEQSHKYSFIVRPEISNSNLWVAFDPGTNGSCMAYGMSSLQTDTDDIYIAENEYEDVAGNKRKSAIFPSKIRINKDSKTIFNPAGFNAEDLQEGENGDFLFGNQAEIFWNQKGINCFQSIKKLLGYTTPQKVIGASNQKVEIPGRDLAHLLVRGLYNHFEKYVRNSRAEDKQEFIHKKFVDDKGHFTPQRAIVAVPNNYTMAKIQEMVDSVKRLNQFKEVHYIYESEAVMMSYFRKEWSKLEQIQHKTFMVYDMGGATINATAFRIRVNVESHLGHKNIRNIEVKTVAKVGYGIGGDDIDFAIIKFVYDIPVVKEYFEKNGIDVAKHQKQNKTILIDLARRIKLDLIEKNNGLNVDGNILSDAFILYSHIREVFNSKFRISLETSLSDNDTDYINEGFKQMQTVDSLVFANVEDAVKELLSSLSKKGEMELIMSGRSVLYPGIKETVLKAIKDNGFDCRVPWAGFNNKDGLFDDEKVKTAVAVGACWYAMYSKVINLKHNHLTSTFGYIDMEGMKPKFVPVITKNDMFDEDGNVKKVAVPIDMTLNNVKFIQMLGNNYTEILGNDIRHKKNFLDEVFPSEITSQIRQIELAVDDKGNFSYAVIVAGLRDAITIQTNPYSRLTDKSVKMEITDENSEAYAFATRNALEEDTSLSVSDIKTDNKQKKNRF